MRQFLIKKEEEGMKLENFVKKVLPNAPLSFIYRIFRQKDVRINNVRKDKKTVLQEGDEVAIYVSEDLFNEFTGRKKIIARDEISSLIVYEDENILIVNKPRGLLVQKDSPYGQALDDMVLSYLMYKGEYDPDNAVIHPGPAHRLDRNTAGIVVFGKNIQVLQQLSTILMDKSVVEKHYLCLVKGIIKDGVIDAPISKISNNKSIIDFDNGKPSKTLYRFLAGNDNYSLVNVTLLTGRTHQIRVHMSYINHPIIGDNKYGDFSLNKIIQQNYHFKEQFLIAYKLAFKKVDGPLSYLSNKVFQIDLDDEMKNLLSNLGLKVPPLV